MLTDDELSLMRSDGTASLPDSGTIWRMPAQTKDGAGGYLAGTLTAAGTVPVRISPYGLRAPEEMVVAQQIGAEAYWFATMPAETDIRSTDQLTSGGVTYEVVRAMAPRTWEILRRVVIRTAE